MTILPPATISYSVLIYADGRGIYLLFLYLSKNSKKKWNFGDFHKYTVCFWRLDSFNSQHVLNVRAIFDFVHNIDLERDLVMFCVPNGRKYLKKTSFVVLYDTTWTPKTMVIVANSIRTILGLKKCNKWWKAHCSFV